MENGEKEGKRLSPRQIWAVSSTSSNSIPHTCTPTLLSSGGLINIGQGQIVTLTQHAAFQPLCPGTSVPAPIDPSQPGVDLDSVFGTQEPFYTSTNPQIYAIAAATAVSYMLVIMLFITPRTFFVGGVGGGGGFLGNRGMIGGSYGNNPVIGVGSRPWLQKAATLAVAVSLTIVTADTFKWAERQYDDRYEDSNELVNKVMDGLEIRVVRVVSETFLWLAQAQTLIRLFPRHKEKLIIKWTAFGLITLELIFSILNFFVDEGHAHPPRFNNAIPAMDYLFALTLNLCYAAFVFYYALCKRRFAFYHPNMRNMPLVALLSLNAVLTPAIFFILDLSKPDVSGWGGYVRWVGAAAASVVVWEWVERIEALERDEKRDGILGREVFDGDEMLEANPVSEFTWAGSSRRPKRWGRPDGGLGSSLSIGLNDLALRTRILRKVTRKEQRQPDSSDSAAAEGESSTDTSRSRRRGDRTRSPSAPAPIASPISRADTMSASSTVYRVRYHPNTEPTPPIYEEISHGQQQASANHAHDQEYAQVDPSLQIQRRTIIDQGTSLTSRLLVNGMSRVLHPFQRQRDSPPIEVAQALSSNPHLTNNIPRSHPGTHGGLLSRLHLKKSQRTELPPEGIVVVPAPQQRRMRSSGEGESENNGMDQVGTEDFAIPNDPGTVPSRNERNTPPDAVLRALHNQSLATSSSQSPQGAGSSLSNRSAPRSAPIRSPSWSRNGTPVISEETGASSTQREGEHEEDRLERRRRMNPSILTPTHPEFPTSHEEAAESGGERPPIDDGVNERDK